MVRSQGAARLRKGRSQLADLAWPPERSSGRPWIRCLAALLKMSALGTERMDVPWRRCQCDPSLTQSRTRLDCDSWAGLSVSRPWNATTRQKCETDDWLPDRPEGPAGCRLRF